MSVELADIRRAVRDLGLRHAPVCVHSSLRSFGHVRGGASTIVTGFLQEGCTVLVPTFSWDFSVPPPSHLRPKRNGMDYDLGSMSAVGTNRNFIPSVSDLDRETMGAIPAAVLSMEQHARGNHPLNSFTAVGPLAFELVSRQAPLDVYKPLEMLSILAGYVVLMGVDLTTMTLLHLAELRAGRTLFRRWANGPDGRPMMVETGSCSRGFEKFASVLAPVQREALVGESHWRVFPAKAALELATEAIRADPWITTCGQPSCARCTDAILGGPILS